MSITWNDPSDIAPGEMSSIAGHAGPSVVGGPDADELESVVAVIDISIIELSFVLMVSQHYG